jgi:predicted MPP superfamily phosphohydrolase
MRIPLLRMEVILGINIMFLTGLISRWLVASPLFTARTKESQPKLRLDANNEFHIAIFSDLHYGEEEDGWGITQDVNSTRVMNNILNSEKPDFVVLSMALHLW